MSTASTKRGDRTRDEILAAATAVVLESGAERFALREVARRADLSPSALYNHFSSREDLIMAVALRALGALSTYLTAVPAGDTAAERLRSLGGAYIRFAQERSAEYRIIFDCLENPATSWERYLGVAEPFTLIVAACAEGLDSGEFTDRSGAGAGGMAYALWALCHGHAMLTSKSLNLVEGDLDSLARSGIESLLAGFATERETS